ncbi:HlyD family secretion protein [Stenotrophomonas maltophilia]|uniref:HlyD family secretion protein n=1 Tax=Stenotrophomonas maltophilia TaxID=40324 RepID=UPI002A9AAA85|nr:HlyD family secretion protein [Stenotrophomonas maltophilia]
MATSNRFKIGVASVVAISLLAAVWVFNSKESNSSSQTTDDAYVRADFVSIVPQVAGVITHVAVEENQRVKAGAPLLSIDKRDLQIALATAQGQVASAEATIAGLKAQLERQQSTIAQAKAARDSSSATLALAAANKKRFASLAADGSGTVQAKEQADADWGIQQAAHSRDTAGLKSAEQQVLILQADLQKAEASLIVANAAKDDAELNLSYAEIAAPVEGVVAQRSARVGGYARVGEPQLTLVPLNALYVDANFRETQMARVQVGQPVNIRVDAIPGLVLKGRVESLAPASGVSFSAVAPHNATGNFTKIVQRLPVRIQILPNQAETQQLRVGMSVRPTIDVEQAGTDTLVAQADEKAPIH